MTKTSKLNITFLAMVIISIMGAFAYSYLTMALELPIYADLLISQLFVLVPAFIYVKAEHWNLHARIGRRHINFTSLLCLIGIKILSMPLLSLLNLVSSLFVPNAAQQLNAQMTGQPTWILILFIAIIPSVLEEFVFRGVFFYGYRNHGFWKAAIVSGIVFGLMHLNFNQFSYGFALGVIFAAVVEATGSIYASMIIHFLINFESVQAISALSKLTEAENGMLIESIEMSAAFEKTYMAVMILILALAAVVATALLILLIKLLAKQCQREDYFAWVLDGGEKEALKHKKTEKITDMYFWAAIIICIIFMIYAV